MARLVAPNPVIERFLAITNSPPVKVLVWPARDAAKVMVSLAAKLLMANLNVPRTLLSAVLVILQLNAAACRLWSKPAKIPATMSRFLQNCVRAAPMENGCESILVSFRCQADRGKGLPAPRQMARKKRRNLRCGLSTTARAWPGAHKKPGLGKPAWIHPPLLR